MSFLQHYKNVEVYWFPEKADKLCMNRNWIIPESLQTALEINKGHKQNMTQTNYLFMFLLKVLN